MRKNGRDKSPTFLILPAISNNPGRSSVPPHLAQIDWITHEARSAEQAYKDLRKQLKKLDQKVTEDRVHRTRVCLRRWFSIWKVLLQDGWQSRSCKRDLIKPLKELQQALGQLRDLDVNIEQGQRLGCSETLLENWREQRRKAKDALESYVEMHDTRDLIKRLGRYLDKRARKIAHKLPAAKAHQSAFDHLELYLLAQESEVREWAEAAKTPEELHRLRLCIKRWRYLLTEFFGLTNLELVRAQQTLGQMHDLDRLTPLLLNDDNELQALMRLRERRKELLLQIEEMRRKLPYGLRPEVTTTKAASPVSFGEAPT